MGDDDSLGSEREHLFPAPFEVRRLFWLSLGGVALAGALGACRSRARPVSAPPVDATYAIAVQPIFDRRCVPCHACYDSACQLTLQSFEGLDRGGNKTIVYHPERAVADRTTRMFQDAQTTATWQSEFGFFPVVDRVHSDDSHALALVAVRESAKRLSSGRNLRRRQDHHVSAKP